MAASRLLNCYISFPFSPAFHPQCKYLRPCFKNSLFCLHRANRNYIIHVWHTYTVLSHIDLRLTMHLVKLFQKISEAMHNSKMMLLVNPMRSGVQVSWGPLERDCTPEDMLHTCDRGSANPWSDSLVNSCTSINQIAAGRLSEDGTTKNSAPAPSGGLKVETFMEERMDLTIPTPPNTPRGKAYRLT